MSYVTITGLAALLSTVLAVYCTWPYIRAVLRGKTKPHQLSWLVFVIMSGIVCLSQYLEGGRASVLISLSFFVGSAAVFVLSLSRGTRDTSRWDRLLFMFALSTIVVWVLTRSNGTAIWLTLAIDVAATSMILLKVRADPYSEDPFPWAVATTAYVFACVTLVGEPVSILYVRPLYGLACDAVLVGYILVARARVERDSLSGVGGAEPRRQP